jgi:hypothetical protein
VKRAPSLERRRWSIRPVRQQDKNIDLRQVEELPVKIRQHRRAIALGPGPVLAPHEPRHDRVPALLDSEVSPGHSRGD